MDKITEVTNLSYYEYMGQMAQLRKLAVEKLGAEKVALLNDKNICDYFRNEGYVPLVVNTADGPNTETIYLIKEENLTSAYDVVPLYR